jgi:hypothetical protein
MAGLPRPCFVWCMHEYPKADASTRDGRIPRFPTASFQFFTLVSATGYPVLLEAVISLWRLFGTSGDGNSMYEAKSQKTPSFP